MRVRVSIGPAGLTEPITFVRLVREHLGWGLKDGKFVLDELANNKSVTVDVPDATAALFRRAVEGLGLVTEESGEAGGAAGG